MRLDWERLFPQAGADFDCLVKNISLDARMPPPTGVAGVRLLYTSQLLDDDMNTKAGTFMKQGAWYDIIRAIDKYDRLWHCRRKHCYFTDVDAIVRICTPAVVF